MKRLIAPLTVLCLAGALVLTGCAKKQEPAGTSTDSTLSLGDVPNEAAPTPESTYAAAPAAEPTPPPATTTTKPKSATSSTKPKPSTPAETPKAAEAPGITVPAGTTLALTMDAEVTTKDKVVGDTFTATLAQDVSVDGKVIFPSGSKISGHIAEAERPGKTSGRGKMVLSYDTIEVNGKSYAIDSMGAPVEGKSGTAGDATKVVGGAAAGAILGKVLGGSAATGAAIGAAAGGGAAMMSRGPDPVIKAGAAVNLSLDHAVTVH